MTPPRRMKYAFRPTVDDSPLEPRIVLSTVVPTVVRTHASLAAAQALNNLVYSLSGQRLNHAVTQQVRAATSSARQAINAQITQLYANGRPTAQQKADFLATANGILDATALRLSTLASLLPGGNDVLVPGIQRALLGSQSNSLASRIEQAVQSDRTARALTTSLTQNVNRATTQRISVFNNYLSGNGPAFASIDQNGQSIPYAQFIGNQIISQLGNTLGMLSQTLPTLANSTLFANGATTATASAQQAFANQTLSALGVAASQLSTGLSLVPGLAPSLTSQLQTGLFGSGSSSLFSTLQSLASTNNGFGAATSTAFTNAFQSLTSPLSSSFILPASQTFQLPTSTFSNLFSSEFSSFGNGFNTGFGSGFPGLGTASSSFNTNFGTGFNNLISTQNTGFGFNIPTLTTGLTGIGGAAGTIDGTGTLTGAGTGTGTAT
ncbi:MAG: hypothetical protein JWN86_3683 [Planctomycetota bacterium]|nr:hypothetical protein [Planctomycetota bacterium]